SNVTSGANIAGHSCTDLAYDPVNHIYYAAERGLGIYKSTDQGNSWIQLPSPFSGGAAPTLNNLARASLAVRAGKVWALLAGGNGGPSTVSGSDTGLSESDDFGSSWNPVNLPVSLYDAGAGAQGD